MYAWVIYVVDDVMAVTVSLFADVAKQLQLRVALKKVKACDTPYSKVRHGRLLTTQYLVITNHTSQSRQQQ